MGRLFVDIFSFDSRIDFQNGYARCSLSYNKNSSLRDILGKVDARLFGHHEFGVNLQSIHCRINGMAVFDNVSVASLIERFGNSLIIEPISLRYCKKDLLVDFDLVFDKYKDFFKTMRFISHEDSLELKKYLALNFISTCYGDDEYLGDGFILYAKWLMGRYPMYEGQIIDYICSDNGIFLHTGNASLLFPENNAIDMLIESIQSEIVMRKNNQTSKEVYDLSMSSQNSLFSDLTLNNIRKDINVSSSSFLQNLLDKNIA